MVFCLPAIPNYLRRILNASPCTLNILFELSLICWLKLLLVQPLSGSAHRSSSSKQPGFDNLLGRRWINAFDLLHVFAVQVVKYDRVLLNMGMILQIVEWHQFGSRQCRKFGRRYDQSLVLVIGIKRSIS